MRPHKVHRTRLKMEGEVMRALLHKVTPVCDLKKKQPAFADWLHADRAFEIQNKTVEVM